MSVMNWTAWGVETNSGDAPEAYILVSGDASGDEVRAPVMVNLLLDRSGSMKGAPLAAAVEAAQQFVELARSDDFMGLLWFDGVAEQVVPVMAMDAKGKQAMAAALEQVTTGRGTALYQALESGARSLQRVLVPGRRPRLLLLTDGEPSVGPDQQDAFDTLGLKLSQQGISVHALGLARHYVAEILSALTLPSGNAFEHVDGPEGLSEAMGAVFSHLFGTVASQASVKVAPTGFESLMCCHGYSSRAEEDALVVSLGDVSRGLSRRVLLRGRVKADGWSARIEAGCVEHGESKHNALTLEKVTPESERGRLMASLNHELELVAAETAAWLSLARRDMPRAEKQLEQAEANLRAMVTLAAETMPVKRHMERLADLRGAVEKGEGDIPLLIRRAQSAKAGTHVSQVIPLGGWRQQQR